MTGFVYFLRCGNFMKVGYSTTPKVRVAGLQTGSPYELNLIAVFPGTVAQEQAVHRILMTVHHRGEWFRCGSEINTIIEQGLPDSDITIDRSDNCAALTKAICIYGGASALARRLKVSRNAVSEWVRAGTLPITRAHEIERLTGVPKHELRPDLRPVEAASGAAA